MAIDKALEVQMVSALSWDGADYDHVSFASFPISTTTLVEIAKARLPRSPRFLFETLITNTSGSSKGGSSNSSSNRNASSSSKSNSNTNSGGGRSDDSYYKPYGGWPGFMHSHGLKPWDLDDVDEGKAILEGYKALDRKADGK
ncbi:hypothetical protein D9756_000067 [Leucocoprinus leucothites]|uniref:Uncharacterized protein n=1 Tax=Leucocoprinus leucothites TaxID=201217 RepID=A0A8H5LNQ8_9AGAR|nr:hypothetical protein D9756_000067 [Leucoagaricus leucothites]